MLPTSCNRSPITITIADANPIANCLLRDQFKRSSNFAVVSCATDRASLLRSVRHIKSAVVLISADLDDGLRGGLAALREVREADPKLRPILLIDRSDPHLVVEGLRLGARGLFLRRNFDLAALRKCVRRVYEGQIWLGNAELEHVCEALAQTRPLRVVNANGLNLLSPREEEVMRLVAEGLGNREIADSLNLSEHTIKNYLFHVFDKLGVSNRVELVLLAVTNSKQNTSVYSQQEKRDVNDVAQDA